MNAPPDRQPSQSRSFASAIVLLVALVAAGFAFWPAEQVQFLFDDLPSIADSEGIPLGDWRTAAFGRVHSPIAGRPLVCMSFALDATLFGLDAQAFRIENLLLHLLAVVLLFSVVRAALRSPNLGDRFDSARADGVAASVASLWALHPLTVDAVAYATQRTTLSMAVFALLAVRAVQLGFTSPRPLLWKALAVLATCAGMACKEEMVAVPILLVLYTRAFVRPSWRGVRADLPHMMTIAVCAWTVLLLCVTNAPHNSTVGYDTKPRCSAFEWLMTQTVPVLDYLRLSIWPHGLRGYYDWPIQRELGAVLLPGLLVCALLAFVVWLWRARPWWGFLGAVFFLLLAPTSSVLPIVTEVVAERRAYLPMLAALVPAVLGLEWLLARVFGSRRAALPIAVLALLAILVPITRARVDAYTDSLIYWTDNYTNNALQNGSFQAGMVLSNYGLELHKQGDLDAAMKCFRRAMDCVASQPIDRMHYAMVLVARENFAMAEPILRTVVEDAPELAEARGNFAALLIDMSMRDTSPRDGVDPRLTEAIEHARAAVELAPRRAAFANTLAWLLAQTGEVGEAEVFYRRAMTLDPLRVDPLVNLSDLLLQQGRAEDAKKLWADLLAAHPRDADLRFRIATKMFERNDLVACKRMLQDAMAIDPSNLAVHRMVAQVLAREQATK
ncbi:MAG: tetratricopeptide repeat protein [Planctomycetota bacterium]